MADRTWSNEVRDKWNRLIHECLKGIGRHVSLFLETRDPIHLEMAEHLREYVRRIKDWILEQEKLHGYHDN